MQNNCILTYCFVVLSLIGSSTLESAAQPKRDLQLQVHGGADTLQLSALRGHVILLEFFSPMCPHCQRVTVTLNRISREYRSKGLLVIGASVIPFGWGVLDNFKKEFGVGFEIAQSNATDAREFLQREITVVPIFAVVDKNGEVTSSCYDRGLQVHGRSSCLGQVMEELKLRIGNTRRPSAIVIAKSANTK